MTSSHPGIIPNTPNELKLQILFPILLSNDFIKKLIIHLWKLFKIVWTRIYRNFLPDNLLSEITGRINRLFRIFLKANQEHKSRTSVYKCFLTQCVFCSCESSHYLQCFIGWCYELLIMFSPLFTAHWSF